MSKLRKNILAIIILMTIISSTITSVSGATFGGSSYEMEREDGYYTMVDEKGKVVQETALPVHVGDEFIDSENNRYRVVKMDGDKAIARRIGQEHLDWDDIVETFGIPDNLAEEQPAQARPSQQVAIYHTHTDESYVPTDGKSSIRGGGGILKVGSSLTEALQNRGVNVIHSTNIHDPHDAYAYERSRRTAVELLKKQPAALIDVHRDAVPARVYQANINGEDVTKVKLVVGRQNPKMSANMDFAKRIKAYLDKTHPGLVEGIFVAKGNYNQDLGPNVILVEVGAHTNSRQDAEKGVAIFADAVPKVVGLQTQANQGLGTKGSWKSIGWLLGIAIVGGIAFMLISSGSWSAARSKLGKEFTNFLGRRDKRDNKEISDENAQTTELDNQENHDNQTDNNQQS